MTSAPSFSGLGNLVSINASSNPSMTSAPDITGCTALTNLYLDNCALSYAPSFSTITQTINITLNNNALVDCTTPLDQLDANGAYNGSIDISGGANQAIDPAYGSLTNLQGKGWTIIFNSL
jgi:hypothetical protein